MTLNDRNRKIGFIGAGQMATALAAGFVRSAGIPAENILAADAYPAARENFTAKTGVRAVENNLEVVRTCDVLFLAVKPQVLAGVLTELGPELTPEKCVVSVVAGVTLETLEESLGAVTRIFRVMPNTPCLVGQGAVAFCPTDAVTQADVELVSLLLRSVARCFLVRETLMDAVTGLSGSGPAYAFLILEALADAGVREGLPRDIAMTLAAQTLRGAAEMVLSTGEHPGVLKDRVASPGGTTIAGLEQLEKHGVRAAMYAAVHAAAERSRELGN